MPIPAKADARKSAKETIESLPEDSTWEDILYHLFVRLFVRRKIESGLLDAEAGRILDTEAEDVRKQLGLNS